MNIALFRKNLQSTSCLEAKVSRRLQTVGQFSIWERSDGSLWEPDCGRTPTEFSSNCLTDGLLQKTRSRPNGLVNVLHQVR